MLCDLKALPHRTTLVHPPRFLMKRSGLRAGVAVVTCLQERAYPAQRIPSGNIPPLGAGRSRFPFYEGEIRECH